MEYVQARASQFGRTRAAQEHKTRFGGGEAYCGKYYAFECEYWNIRWGCLCKRFGIGDGIVRDRRVKFLGIEPGFDYQTIGEEVDIAKMTQIEEAAGRREALEVLSVFLPFTQPSTGLLETYAVQDDIEKSVQVPSARASSISSPGSSVLHERLCYPSIWP